MVKPRALVVAGFAVAVGALVAYAATKPDSLRVVRSRTIADAAAPERLVMRLDFETPFEARNSAIFAIMPHDCGLEASWAMKGPAPLVTKAIGMDKMVGGDFEEGLCNLKGIAEKP